jgi:hypothetical protein
MNRLFTIGLVLAACASYAQHDHDEHGHAGEAGARFKEGSGLHFPPDTEESIGLTLAEVEEREIYPEWPVVLQVFHTDERGARASGFLDLAAMRRLQPGQAIHARHTRDGDLLAGRITGLDEQAGAATGRGEVIALFDEGIGDLTTGSFLDAVAADPAPRTATVIPASALLRTASGDFVYVVNGAYYLRTPVVAGAVSGDRVEIADGLYPGDQVVAAPAETLWLTELRAVKGGGHSH